MKFTFSILLVIFFIYTSYSQTFENWVRRVNGPDNFEDEGYAIALDIDGNVYVTGKVYDSGKKCFIGKYNSMGAMQWNTYYSNDVSQGQDIVVDASGNAYVGGYIQNGSYTSYLLIKYNSSGAEQWVRTYSGPGGGGTITSMALSTSGDLYVTGYNKSTLDDYDCVTIKYNSSGTQQWIQRFNSIQNGDDVANSITLDNSNNMIYVTGSTFNGSNDDYITIKYNLSGVQQWFQTYNGTSGAKDYGSHGELDASGNFYVTGTSNENIQGNKQCITTIKYNSSGSQQWVQNFTAPYNTQAEGISIALSPTENSLYVVGDVVYNNNWDIVTIKYNSSGVQQWFSLFDGSGYNDIVNCLKVDEAGIPYLAGFTTVLGSYSQSNLLLLSYKPSSGQERCNKVYNGEGNDLDGAYDIDVHSETNPGYYPQIVLTGWSDGYGTWEDIVTLKYSNEYIGINSGTNEDLFSVAFLNSSTAYMVGSGIMKSTDVGLNWSIVNEGNGNTLYSICFKDNAGTAVGCSGTILRSEDDPDSWVAQSCGTDNDLYCVNFSNSDNGTITGNNGTIMHTTNGGTNWSRQTCYTDARLNAVYFIDNNVGYIAGDSGIILYSTNSGANWDLLNSSTSFNLYSIYFTNENEGFAAGESGCILRTIDGGNEWNSVSLDIDSTLSLKSVFFISPGKGYIAGENGIIYSTTNSGDNWQQMQSNTNNNLNSIVFASENVGIAIGQAGTVILSSLGETTDNVGLKNNNSLNFINKTSLTPQKFELYQNYPNPFNPTTTIKYDIPQTSNVTIIVYDLLGREITCLVNNELKNAGSYEIEWDAKNNASGIYLYRITCGNYESVKKMVLIK